MRFQRTRYIPKNALPITEESGLGVVYVYPCAGKYGAIGYAGERTKADFHYTFKTDAKLDEHIADYFKRLQGHKRIVAERRETRFKGHSFVVGDIITNSWGYDQTNVDWYVVKRTTKNYVWLKPIASELVEGEASGPMAGHESVKLDENLNVIELDEPETKHQAQGDACTMRHGCGSKWDRRSQYRSWYA